jgi:hypothetical protein
MIDKTTLLLKHEHEFVQLFCEMKEYGAFQDDKTADVKVSPASYAAANYLALAMQNPLRLMIGDYVIRLHC